MQRETPEAYVILRDRLAGRPIDRPLNEAELTLLTRELLNDRVLRQQYSEVSRKEVVHSILFTIYKSQLLQYSFHMHKRDLYFFPKALTRHGMIDDLTENVDAILKNLDKEIVLKIQNYQRCSDKFISIPDKIEQLFDLDQFILRECVELSSAKIIDEEDKRLFQLLNKVQEYTKQALKVIVKLYSWEGIAGFGVSLVNKAFFIVQHADDDREFQIETLEIFERVKEKIKNKLQALGVDSDIPDEMTPLRDGEVQTTEETTKRWEKIFGYRMMLQSVAMLTDRIAVKRKLKQKYGTQVFADAKTQEIILAPCEAKTVAELNKLRETMGLPP